MPRAASGWRGACPEVRRAPVTCGARSVTSLRKTRRGSAHDDVDELVRHDDHLGDVLAVQVGAHVRLLAGQRLELLARRAARLLDAVADLPVDLADQLER